MLNESQVEKAVLSYISESIKSTEFEGHVFLAGGAVRDEVMGIDAKDLDLLIDLPNGGIKFAEWICKKSGCYVKDSNPVIYPKFGTAKFNLRHVTYQGLDLSNIDLECVMTRTEKYTKNNRKPEVAYGSLKDDVMRRDLTINSLLKDLSTGEIKDLTGMGISDIKNGIVRTPIDSNIIYKEDPLRMLRTIRFAVKYSWDIPLELIKSIRKNSYMLEHISVERIQSELNKILVSKNPDKGIRFLQITGLNKFIIPELDGLKGMKQNKFHEFDVLGHTTRVLKGVKPEIINRLAGLMHDIGKVKTKQVIDGAIHFYEHEDVSAEMVKEILTRLKYSNEIIDAVYIAVKNHMKIKYAGDDAIITDKALRKLKYDLGDHLEHTLDLMDADNHAHSKGGNMPNQITKIRHRLSDLIDVNTSKINLPINGDDIMKEFNLSAGKEVGKIKDIAIDIYMENPNISKEEMIKLLKEKYNEI